MFVYYHFYFERVVYKLQLNALSEANKVMSSSTDVCVSYEYHSKLIVREIVLSLVLSRHIVMYLVFLYFLNSYIDLGFFVNCIFILFSF